MSERVVVKSLRELDALVAARIFDESVGPADEAARCELGWDYQTAGGYCVEPYSADIAAAWEVVGKVASPERRILNLAGPYLPTARREALAEGARWGCMFRVGAEEDFIGGDTAPLAICLAALAAHGVDVVLELAP